MCLFRWPLLRGNPTPDGHYYPLMGNHTGSLVKGRVSAPTPFQCEVPTDFSVMKGHHSDMPRDGVLLSRWPLQQVGGTISYQGLWLLKQLNLCLQKPFGLFSYHDTNWVCSYSPWIASFLPGLFLASPRGTTVYAIPAGVSGAAISTHPATARGQGRWVRMLCPVHLHLPR